MALLSMNNNLFFKLHFLFFVEKNLFTYCVPPGAAEIEADIKLQMYIADVENLILMLEKIETLPYFVDNIFNIIKTSK